MVAEFNVALPLVESVLIVVAPVTPSVPPTTVLPFVPSTVKRATLPGVD